MTKPTNEERREVAARLRDFERLRGAFAESSICAFSDALGGGYLDWEQTCASLADLIEPEPERTCRMRYDPVHCDYVCTNCGEWHNTGMYDACDADDRVLLRPYRYCPECGARVEVER